MDSAEPPHGPHSTPPVARSGAPHRYGARFVGMGNDYFEIALINWLLVLVTLGLFTAWARMRTYRFFHSSTWLGEHEFRFTGEAWPLFKGILLAAVLLAAMQITVWLAFELLAEPVVVTALAVVYALLLDYLGHYAYFQSRRYRFAYTTYREIHFQLLGSPTEFAVGAFVRSIGMVLTLGLLYPLYQNYVYKSIYNNLCYGNLRFRYTGDDDEYMRTVIPGFILALLTLGIYYFWWYPRVYGYFVDHLYVEDSRVQTSMISPGELFKLHAGNFALAVFTLGLGTPFVAVRTAHFFVSRICLEGQLDLDDAVQSYRHGASTFGEGLVEEMDLDVDLGF
jgi:uncharacterized membrane protein YjgN (DUF898 family)